MFKIVAKSYRKINIKSYYIVIISYQKGWTMHQTMTISYIYLSDTSAFVDIPYISPHGQGNQDFSACSGIFLSNPIPLDEITTGSEVGANSFFRFYFG